MCIAHNSHRTIPLHAALPPSSPTYHPTLTITSPSRHCALDVIPSYSTLRPASHTPCLTQRPIKHIALPIIPPLPTYHRAHYPSLPAILLYLLYCITCQATRALFRPASHPTLLVIPECQTHCPACHTTLADIPPFLFHHCPLCHTTCHFSLPVNPLCLWYCPYRRSSIPVISLCSSYLFAHHTPTCLSFSPTRDSTLPVIPPFLLYHPVRDAILPVILPYLLLRHRSVEIFASYVWWTIVFQTNFSGPMCQAASKISLALLCAKETPSRSLCERETNAKIR